jgi:hypothetical protein
LKIKIHTSAESVGLLTRRFRVEVPADLRTHMLLLISSYGIKIRQPMLLRPGFAGDSPDMTLDFKIAVLYNRVAFDT